MRRSAASRDMDERGHLPIHPCTSCGKPLSGADGPRPAETHAGTHTGLCYGCTKAPVFIRFELPDGTREMSYPPHLPSWRRDRERFWAHPDCSECGAAGRRWISRSDAHGGSYPGQCQACGERVYRIARANEVRLLRDVRDALACAQADREAVSACKQVTLEAVACAIAAFADDPEPYRPSWTLPLGVLNSRIGPSDLRVRRATTLLKRFVAALDVEIAERRA
jgi:hypothetical protein